MTSQPNRAKLTKGYVDRIKPGPKDAFHWDTEVKGFAIRVTPTGKTTFVVQGRVEGSDKEARITIGSYGVFTVDQARDVAREQARAPTSPIELWFGSLEAFSNDLRAGIAAGTYDPSDMPVVIASVERWHRDVWGQ